MNRGDDLQALLKCLRDLRGYEVASRARGQELRANGIADAAGRLRETILDRYPDQHDAVEKTLSQPGLALVADRSRAPHKHLSKVMVAAAVVFWVVVAAVVTLFIAPATNRWLHDMSVTFDEALWQQCQRVYAWTVGR